LLLLDLPKIDEKEYLIAKKIKACINQEPAKTTDLINQSMIKLFIFCKKFTQVFKNYHNFFIVQPLLGAFNDITDLKKTGKAQKRQVEELQIKILFD